MMKSSRLPLILPAAMMGAVLAVLSCGSGRDGGKEAAPAEQVGSDSVTAYVDIREMGYAALEPVPMRLVVRNDTERTLRFAFPTGQRFDFIVTKVKRPVWSWSEGRVFGQSPGEITIAPGDSMVYEYTWDGKLADGRLPGLGRYWVRGRLMTAPPVETGTRQFGIVD